MDDGHIVGTLEQLSFGGFLCKTSIAFEPGRVLTFKIEVGDRELVTVGEVVYRRDSDDQTSYMCGVRFEYLSHGDQERLKALIASAIDTAA
jgi:hypothetical protein